MQFAKSDSRIQEADMTPMIDMTFQLVAFLMIMCNFTESEADQRVVLPESTLAKPVETTPDNFFTVQLTEDGTCILEGREVALGSILDMLQRKAQYYETRNKPLADVTVIVRAHGKAPTGKVQELIKKCQEAGFERFVLRAKEKFNY
jgi:biopolymer transport protein ExbD